MSVKIYDKEQKKWIIFPGTIGAPGKDAYLIAQKNGYTGTKEEYAKVLTDIPKIINSIEEKPTEGSKNLITSGGVWQAIDDVHTTIDNQINIISDKVDINTENISNIEQDITNIRTTEILDQIKSSIVDNLESLAADKSLSANQGRILKETIANLANLQIEIVDQLPSVGETNIIYLVKKSSSAPDIHDEYVFVDGKWEKIGNTEIDLSNYYTRAEVDAKIPVIPNIETSISGAGNVITLIEVDANNKHKVNATKGISVYTQQEVDDKLTGFGAGDVIAAEAFTTADRVITSNGPGKTVKDSGILINNLALKSYVDEKEIAWDKVTGKPETYVPAAHTHPLAQITDAGALAYKDKVDESDLNFDIPEGIVVDSSLSTTSVNPVQNKVVTEALNNRYTKSETYSQSEIDEKIGSAGGGDVMASGDLANNYIVVGAGTKSIKKSEQLLSDLALKSDIPSLDGYATESWVGTQNFITMPEDLAEDRIVIGAGTNSVTSKRLKTINGVSLLVDDIYNVTNYNISRMFPWNALTGSGNITRLYNYLFDGVGQLIPIEYNNSAYTNLPVDGESFVGTLQPYKYTAANNWSVRAFLTSENTGKTYTGVFNMGQSALINWIEIGKDITSSEIVSALGFTPISSNEIPVALPNPYALSITANGTNNSYTGSSVVNINLDSIFSKKLKTVTTPGQPGIFVGTGASGATYEVDTLFVSADEPDAIIVIPSSTSISFDNTIYTEMQDLGTLTGGTYKCYCITYINSSIVLVNGAIYGNS